jgi:hypothetical protein
MVVLFRKTYEIKKEKKIMSKNIKKRNILFIALFLTLFSIISSSYDINLNQKLNAFAQTPDSFYDPGAGPIPEDNSTDLGNGPIPKDNSSPPAIPEFGPLAMMITAISVFGVIALSSKFRSQF